MKSTKLVIITPVFPPRIGGIEDLTYGLAQKLSEKGVHLTVISSFVRDYDRGKKWYTFNFKTRLLKSIPFPYKNFYFTFHLIKGEVLKDIYSSNIVHIFSYFPNSFLFIGFMLAIIFGKKIVYTPIYLPSRMLTYRTFLRKVLGRTFDLGIGKILVRMADMVVALTEGERHFYIKAFGKNSQQVITIPEGVKGGKGKNEKDINAR